MTVARILRILTISTAAICCVVAQAQSPLQNKEAAAEAALKNCELERSLKLWREILAAEPGHERATFVVTRLTTQALDLDSHLAVIQTLIGKGVIDGTSGLLAGAARRAATDAQKARILYLRGLLAQKASRPAKAGASFESALKLYADTEWGARSAIALAKGTPARAARLLRGVVDNGKVPSAVRQEAALELLLEASGWTSQQRIAALRRLLGQTPDAGVKRQILTRIVQAIVAAGGRWTAEAIETSGAILQTDPPYGQAAETLQWLTDVADRSQDAAALDAVLKVLGSVKLKDEFQAREARFIRADAFISRAVVEDDKAAMSRYLAQARQAIDQLGAGRQTPAEVLRARGQRGRLRLVKAQKLAVLAGPVEALPAIMAAKEHYLTALPGDPAGSLARLKKIGKLLEHAKEYETAIALYRDITDRFPQLAQGRDALLNVARLYEARLNAPLAALEVYAEYAGRYPAELPYRQMGVGQRLKRLGYANVLDFQKRNGLTPDGVFGPDTRRKLRQLEATFDVIRVSDGVAATPGRGDSLPGIVPASRPLRMPIGPPGERASDILRGQFVHPKMYGIARRLQTQGRHHDAIRAYLLMLNLFPTKRQADDALLAVARLFRDNFLFEEALGAYTELMEYFPKGNQTSEAYIEAAACLENLGRWVKARSLYELYVKKFPKYKHVRLCRGRIKLLDEIQQYQDFLAANPNSAKAPEAQYQIAAILYKQLKNSTKAAVEFALVAQRYPKHVRAADGLYTAGVAHLRTENFPAARKAFAQLVSRYPESRLADDSQYWIGHTYEYAARALGRLDKRHIVLRQRSGRQRTALLADVTLRRQYYPQAKPGPQLPEDVWTADALGVLTSGSKRDRANAELFRAIAAYRKVAEGFKMSDKAGDALHRIGVIYTDYLKDPDKGFQAYQELLAHYPGTKVAMNALYQVGAYHLKNKKYDQAVKSYRQFVYNYPNDERVQDAMLAVARCHMETKTYDKALDAYQSYLNKFPDGRHTPFAEAQITWIRTYHY